MQVKTWWNALTEAASAWSSDNAMRLSAALAYYAILSLAPLALITIAISGWVYGEQAASGQVTEQIRQFAGEQVGNAITSIIESAQRKRSGASAALLGTLVLVVGASGVFGELKEAMNSIWGVAVKPGRAISTIICERLVAIILVLTTGLVMILALAASAVLAAVKLSLSAYFPIPVAAIQITEFLISLAINSLLFSAIFKWLPDVEIRWRDVWVSGIVTALLFTVGKLLLGIYLGTSGISSSYGAAGAVIVVLVWTYYSACILFFGAELSKVCLRRCGKGVIPAKNAMLTKPSPPQQPE